MPCAFNITISAFRFMGTLLTTARCMILKATEQLTALTKLYISPQIDLIRHPPALSMFSGKWTLVTIKEMWGTKLPITLPTALPSVPPTVASFQYLANAALSCRIYDAAD